MRVSSLTSIWHHSILVHGSSADDENLFVVVSLIVSFSTVQNQLHNSICTFSWLFANRPRSSNPCIHVLTILTKSSSLELLFSAKKSYSEFKI